MHPLIARFEEAFKRQTAAEREAEESQAATEAAWEALKADPGARWEQGLRDALWPCLEELHRADVTVTGVRIDAPGGLVTLRVRPRAADDIWPDELEHTWLPGDWEDER